MKKMVAELLLLHSLKSIGEYAIRLHFVTPSRGFISNDFSEVDRKQN